MKKLILFVPLLAILLFLSICSDAPEIEFPEPTDRFVLAELFTEDFGTFCALAERVLMDTVGADYGDTLVVISYHPRNTYQNPVAVAREAFYNTGLPPWYVIFDGTIVVWEQGPPYYDNVFRQAIEVARTVTPYFNLYINNATASPSTGNLDFSIITADTIPEGEIIAYVAILQDSLPGSYITFQKVCQELYAFPLELTYPDTLDTVLTFAHTIPVSDMSAVIFVQDTMSKEVMQSIGSPFQEE